MSGKAPGAISFGEKEQWIACNQSAVSRWAKNDEVSPLAVRVLFAAMSGSDKSGHAPLAVGELRRILGSVDKVSGEMTEPRADVVSSAINAAKRLGYIHASSNARCLVLSYWDFQKAYGSGRNCKVH